MLSSIDNIEYYVSIEEFIPRINVNHMLGFTETLEKLEPMEPKPAFGDLKRAMVWMARYISPTSEFWEVSSDRFEIDGKTVLTVQLLGFGWAVVLSSRKPVTEQDIGPEEKRLITLMDSLTQHIPVNAILRLKASSWSKRELKEVAKILKFYGTRCSVQGTSLHFPEINIRIYTEPYERLECLHISRSTARKVEVLLKTIKEYANQRHEGANWCCYERRRLTLVRKIGTESISSADEKFVQHQEYEMPGEVLISQVRTSENLSATVCFFRTRYHQGNIHPRSLIASTASKESLRELTTYIYYLWNSYSTRIRHYMLFEDLYAYADNLRSSHKYVDPQIDFYWHNILKIDDIITELRTHKRIDQGKVQSYIPPHDKFTEHGVSGAHIAPIEMPLYWLKHFLIEATTTQLHEDPLTHAVKLLERMDQQMKTSLNLFVQTISIRMQRTLQVLQVLFVIGAISSAIQVIGPLSIMTRIPFIASLLRKLGVTIPLTSASIFRPIANLVIIILLTIVSIFLLRKSFLRKIDQIMQ